MSDEHEHKLNQILNALIITRVFAARIGRAVESKYGSQNAGDLKAAARAIDLLIRATRESNLLAGCVTEITINNITLDLTSCIRTANSKLIH